VDKPALPRVARGDGDAAHAHKGARRAFVPERDVFEDVSVYDGHRLLAGDRIAGPALIERTDTTVFVSGDYAARVDDHGTLVLSHQEASR
jgi:N-methylhydantoinase A